MTQTPIEVPIMIISTSGASMLQIAPAPQLSMLHAGRQLSRIPDFDVEFDEWLQYSSDQDARDDLRNLLEQVGRSVFEPLQPDDLHSLLQLGLSDESRQGWRRILVYTDSASSTVPIETMWSKADIDGAPMGFVAAHKKIPVSIIRHLGLGSLVSTKIGAKQPIRMLVVISNPKEPHMQLGTIEDQGNCLSFPLYRNREKDQEKATALGQEIQALETHLGKLVKLGLIELHFLVGNDSVNNSIVYRGQYHMNMGKLGWEIEARIINGDLSTAFLDLLSNNEWHVLHYFGHGVTGQDPQLVLRPGDNLSCTQWGESVGQMPSIVILNACESANPTDANAPVLTGFATLCLSRGTVNLICMQKKVSPETATLTTRRLYEKLSQSLFTRQMDFEEALYQVRQRVHNGENPRLDFFCPVLYVRPVRGPIFVYQDDRLSIWNLIREEELTLHPIKLYKVASWLTRLYSGNENTDQELPA